MDLDVELVFLALEAIGVACLWNLWFRKRAPLLRKAGWTLAILVPLFGPLFYYALYPPPLPQPELLRAKRTDGVEIGAHNV